MHFPFDSSYRASGETSAEPSSHRPWGVLRTHCVLAPFRVHMHGDGVLYWISQLTLCMGVSQELAEWYQECTLLLRALGASDLPHGSAITERARREPLWHFIAECLNARQKALRDTTPIDLILARAVCHGAATQTGISLDFLHGLHQLYKSARFAAIDTRRSDWEEILDAISDPSHSLAAQIIKIKSPTKKNFLIQVDKLLKSTVPSVKPTVNLAALRQMEALRTKDDAQEDARSTARLQEQPGQTSPDISVIEKDDGHGAEASAFKPGDPVCRYLQDQAPFTPRRSRIGLPNNSSTLAQQVLDIASHATEELIGCEDEVQQAAHCLLQLQLTLPVPIHVLLATRCRPCEDLYLDPLRGNLHVSRAHLLPDGGQLSWGGSDRWTVSTTEGAAYILKQRSTSHPDAEYLHHLLCTQDIGDDNLTQVHHKLLKKLSDANLPAWPSHWVAGVRHAAINALRSELLASVVLTYPGLCAAGSLHYFHPRQVDIDVIVSNWHACLNLTGTTT